IVEALELVVYPRRGLRQPVELSIAFSLEEPDAVGPVSGVVAHRHQERDARREQVPQQWNRDAHDRHQRDDRPGYSVESLSSVLPEEEERAVDHEEITLDRHTHRDVARQIY